MSVQRSKSNGDQYLAPRPAPSTAAASESLRSAAVQPPAPSRGEERISLFWRIFGGTILSIVALVCITVYQSFAGTLSDLRASILHINEVQANLATKDDVNAKATALWGASKDVTVQSADLKTRTALLETQLRSAEEDRKELARQILSLRDQVQALQLRLADVGAKKADSPKKADAD